MNAHILLSYSQANLDEVEALVHLHGDIRLVFWFTPWHPDLGADGRCRRPGADMHRIVQTCDEASTEWSKSCPTELSTKYLSAITNRTK